MPGQIVPANRAFSDRCPKKASDRSPADNCSLGGEVRRLMVACSEVEMGTVLGVELENNSFFSLRVDFTQRLLFLIRSSREFQTIEHIDRCTAALARAFPVERRTGFSLLADFRQAPLRVTPVLDLAFARFRRQSETGFECVAVIAGTAIGRVRAVRLSVNSACLVEVVTTVDEGLLCISEARVKSCRLLLPSSIDSEKLS